MDQDNRAADSTQSHKDNDQSQQNTTLQSTVTTGPVAKGGSVTGIKIVDSIIRAAVHVPGWAWVAGVFLISIAVIIFAALSNLEPIGRTIQALKPTPTAFAPAKPGETLIIVADFEDRSEGSLPTMDPAQDIFDRLDEQIRVGQFDIRVERLSQLVNDSTAQSVLETNGAFLLVWGWYDSLSIKPRLERSATIQDIDIDQEGNVLSLIDSERTILDVKTADLPNLTQYLVMLILGMDRYQNSELQEAQGFFTSAIEQIGDLVKPSQAYFFLGQIAFDAINPQRDLDKAIEYFTAAIRAKPDHVGGYNNRGLVHYLKEDYPQAVQDYTAAIQLEPENYYALTNRATAYTALRDYAQAIKDINTAIKLEPDNPRGYEIRGDVFSEQGEDESAKNDYETAIAYHQSEIQTNPSDFYPYARIGYIFGQLGNNENSIQYYTEAIKRRPNDPRLYKLRSLRYSDDGKQDMAIQDIEAAIELNQFDAMAHQLLSIQYINKAQFDPNFLDVALEHLNTAIQLESDDDSLYILRGKLLVIIDEIKPNSAYVEKARDDFLKTIEITQDPDYKAEAEAELRRLEGR